MERTKMGRGKKQINSVDDGMRSFLGKDNCIQQPRIIRKSYLFKDDGVYLSDIGNDYLFEDFRLKIKQNIQHKV